VLEAAEDEYRRLLYVAMTRAADRLIVCGADGLRARPKGCWYDLVRQALDNVLVAEGDGDNKVLRYRKAPLSVAADAGQAAAADASPPPRDLPSWLRQPAPAEPWRPAPLSPSSAFDEEIGRRFADGPAAAADRQKALERGRLVHRLMQSLPDIAVERRMAAAERYLAAAATGFSAAERVDIAAQVLAILDDASFAPVFAAGSRAEVPIVGRIAGAGADADAVPVAGQVDRLTITAEAVLIADYKTDRRVPQRLDEVEPYVAQLALYRAVLAQIYPQRTIRAALFFTEGPRLLEIPAAAMDAALRKVLAGRAAAPARSLDAPRTGS
jgi:ATP-dependent helicase/nuclease subunit A